MAATITQQNRTASGELALVQAFVNTRNKAACALTRR
jgi:hypothetical protein